MNILQITCNHKTGIYNLSESIVVCANEVDKLSIYIGDNGIPLILINITIKKKNLDNANYDSYIDDRYDIEIIDLYNFSKANISNEFIGTIPLSINLKYLSYVMHISRWVTNVIEFRIEKYPYYDFDIELEQKEEYDRVYEYMKLKYDLLKLIKEEV